MGLLEKSGREFSSEEEKEEAVEELTDKVETKLERAMLEALPYEYLEQVYREFKKEDTDAETLAKILQESGVDMGKLVEETLEKMQKEYLGGENE